VILLNVFRLCRQLRNEHKKTRHRRFADLGEFLEYYMPNYSDYSPTLQTLIERMPNKPYCSNDLTQGLIIRPKGLALTHKYIQHNQSQQVQALVVDIDHDYSFEAADSASVQLPSLMVLNPENGHGHAIYILKEMVAVSASAHMKPQQWLAGLERAYTRRLGGDMGYSGLICRNPLLHQILDTSRIYDMAELDAPLDYQDKAPYERIEMEHGTGRNCTMFDTVRLEAYAEVGGCSSHDQVHDFATSRCTQVNNNFMQPLALSEVRATAKSIAKWTWKMRDELANYKQINRGRYGCTRQEAGRMTAQLQQAKSDANINVAMQQLTEARKKLSVAAIAKLANVSRTTVYAYMKRQVKN